MTVAIAKPTEHSTLLDALLASFADSRRTPANTLEPVVILWPDPDQQWRPVIGRLREAFAHVYALGAYALESKSGPAIWLRCIVDRTLPEISPPSDTTPVFYLPGVSRQMLRAGAECPVELQPLIELQFRGRVWHQPSGQEWSVDAFLSSRHGLALDVARDVRTREAVSRTLVLLADADASSLRDRRLQAEDFDALAVEDPVRDLLRWMNDPEGTRRALEDVRWRALSSRARATFGFDPSTDPPLEAADRLIAGDKRWSSVWSRFSENPRIYRGVAALLREADEQASELALDPARRPRANDEAESALRVALQEVALLPHHEACNRTLQLEATHASRRHQVWAQLGESPFVGALEHLARVAYAARTPLAGTTATAIADAYAEWGWRADAAALEAIASVTRATESAVVNAALRALYLPWLDASARHLQDALARVGQIELPTQRVEGDRDTCVLFADGLRFDIAASLQRALETRGLTCQLSRRFSAIPTVTPTAKPAASPIADALTGHAETTDFAPVFVDTDVQCTAERLREEMARRDITVLSRDEVRVGAGEHGGWTEAGQIDEMGHKLGLRLAREIPSELEYLADRIAALIEGGWERVRVVTDHGWLLVPGGLPKVELPKSVTATRWARCAVMAGESATDMPVWPWRWNRQVRIASPHGVASFVAGHDYAHGGVSAQECVVPELIVQRGKTSVSPTITDVKWTRLRCRVTALNADGGSSADIRLVWKDAHSSIVAAPKALDAGQASLVVPDDQHEGAAAVVVLIDSEGGVVARVATTVGGDA